MVRNNTFFLISGFISISLFTFFAYFFVHMLFGLKKDDVFALKKDNYISISLNNSFVQAKKSIKKSKITKKPKIVKKTISDSTAISNDIATPETDVGNLFSDVWTKKINKKIIKKRKIDNKRFQEIQKKVKTLNNKDVKDISEIVKNIDKISTDSDKLSPSTSNEVNEYLAKIQALVYDYFNPPPNSQGNSVKAVIELSAIGKVIDFRILNYSTNSALNRECDELKSRLEKVLFPVNPQHESGNYIIILTSKE